MKSQQALPCTIIHTPQFIREAQAILSDDELSKLEFAIGTAPLAGALVKNTGGARKIRFASADRGKSGSIRAIYSYRQNNQPVILLGVYSKARKSDLSDTDKQRLRNQKSLLRWAA